MYKSPWRKLSPLVVSLVLLMLTLEGGIRLGIALNFSWLKDPDLYADWTADDDYWKLRQLWGKRVMIESKTLLDPFLGWTPAKTAQNPLATISDQPYTPDYKKPALLFVGDAFVEGSTDLSKRIPQKLGTLLPKIPVYNLGMGGYGLDQIYLRLQQTAYPFSQPIAVIGMVTVDLDRSLLGFRTGPKPYFSLVNDHLLLRGVPIPENPKKWLEIYPPQIKSYALALLERNLRLWHGGNPLEVMYMREPKMAINTKILSQMETEARAKKMPLYFVIFYNLQELNYNGWRERFLRDTLEKLQIAYLDTKPLLIESARSEHVPPGTYYLSDGHLNERGNAVVAQTLANRLKKDAQSATWVN